MTKDCINSLKYLHVSNTVFFWMFGTHVIFAEIWIIQLFFLHKKVFVHIKGSFEYMQKLIYILTFAVLLILGNWGRVQQ